MVKLYHGTCLLALEGIEKEQSIIPNRLHSSDALNEGYSEEEYYGYLFFTDSISNAIHYSTLATANNVRSPLHQSHWGDLTVVLEIELPEKLLLPDLHDAPNAQNWKESMEYCRSARYQGVIPTTAIQHVLLCHYDLDEPIVKCSFSDWKESLSQYGHLFSTEYQDTAIKYVEDGKTPLFFKK